MSTSPSRTGAIAIPAVAAAALYARPPGAKKPDHKSWRIDIAEVPKNAPPPAPPGAKRPASDANSLPRR